jgi:transglutaminase-like putative cysteine protease
MILFPTASWMLRAAALLFSLLLCHTPCLAEGSVTKGLAPGWALVKDSPFPDAEEDEDGAERYLVVDVQRHAEEKAIYESFATRVLSAAGVEDHSQLSVHFQPSYQSLVWHHLDVIRGGEKQDRLEAVEFELIRREEGMESSIYDGEITAHVILKDIRPGDIISYSFTTQGENPVLAGATHEIWTMGYSVPVGRVHRSVIWDPALRTMAWQLNGLGEKPREQELPDGLRRMSYERLNPEKITAEKNTPPWFNDFPNLEFSDFTSWEDLGKWAVEIYTRQETLPPELKEVCDDIRKEGGTPQEQALKVLRWSQENIRYLGSFLGEHTHAPYPLEVICARRFGDCKDKGMLTVAMLHELGFDAAPALVNTDLLAAVAEMLPGHGCFDHLIVHLELEGKDYWLDPTRTFQRGSLDKLYSPPYGFAFVVREGVKALRAVKPSGFVEAGIDIRESFDITDDLGNGTLTVTTVSTGVNADNLRRSLADDGRAELENSYREHYAKDYPGIEIAAPMVVRDDEQANQITTVENYRLKGFFTEPETSDGQTGGSVYARDIGSYMTIPEAKDRKHPYSISHPVHRSQTIELKITKDWSMEAENFSASLAAVDYHYSVLVKGQTLVLHHDYRSRADHVEPGEFAAYTKAMKDAGDRTYFDFTYPLNHTATESGITNADEDNQSVKSYFLVSLCLLTGLIIGGIAMIALYFWDPRPRESTMLNPRSIGGWLILPAIICFVAPFYSIYVISSYFNSISDGSVSLFSGASDENMWRLNFGICVLMEGILLPLTVLQLVLLFKKRTSFPYLFAALLLINFGSLLITFALQSSVDVLDNEAKVGGQILGNLLRIVIWVAYIFLSQRVRATFIHRRKKVRIVPPPPLPQMRA